MAVSQLSSSQTHKGTYDTTAQRKRLPHPKHKRRGTKGAPSGKGRPSHANRDDNLEVANEIREIYGLPPLEEKQPADVIRGLSGMMEAYSEVGEDPVDAIKSIRISE